MNRKTIKKKLEAKISEWIDSIADEKLRLLVKENTIVTGGSICSMLLNEDPKDYDIYFKNKETTMKVAEYYLDLYLQENPSSSIYLIDGAEVPKMNEEERSTIPPYVDEDRVYLKIETGVSGEVPIEDAFDVIEDEELKKYRPVFLSSNAITLSDKIQIIIRFYGDAEEIHSNYDFVHTTNSWNYEDGLVLKQEALESILAKELIYQGSKYPICSIIRTRKFIKRGWNINAGQYLKMVFQCGDFDLRDINVLQDQLVGVDSAYFGMLIEALDGADENKMNSSYVCKIIDKVFS